MSEGERHRRGSSGREAWRGARRSRCKLCFQPSDRRLRFRSPTDLWCGALCRAGRSLQRRDDRLHFVCVSCLQLLEPVVLCSQLLAGCAETPEFGLEIRRMARSHASRRPRVRGTGRDWQVGRNSVVSALHDTDARLCREEASRPPWCGRPPRGIGQLKSSVAQRNVRSKYGKAQVSRIAEGLTGVNGGRLPPSVQTCQTRAEFLG